MSKKEKDPKSEERRIAREERKKEIAALQKVDILGYCENNKERGLETNLKELNKLTNIPACRFKRCIYEGARIQKPEYKISMAKMFGHPADYYDIDRLNFTEIGNSTVSEKSSEEKDDKKEMDKVSIKEDTIKKSAMVYTALDGNGKAMWHTFVAKLLDSRKRV